MQNKDRHWKNSKLVKFEFYSITLKSASQMSCLIGSKKNVFRQHMLLQRKVIKS